MRYRMPKASKALFAGALLAASCGAAIADDTRLDAVGTANKFYAALSSGAIDGTDRGAVADSISGLLGEAIEVELQDLGITQTRDEFVESLDGLFDALDGGRVVYRVEQAADVNATNVLVCYDFASNQMLTRETLTVEAGVIVSMVQQQVGETCDAL